MGVKEFMGHLVLQSHLFFKWTPEPTEESCREIPEGQVGRPYFQGKNHLLGLDQAKLTQALLALNTRYVLTLFQQT